MAPLYCCFDQIVASIGRIWHQRSSKGTRKLSLVARDCVHRSLLYRDSTVLRKPSSARLHYVQFHNENCFLEKDNHLAGVDPVTYVVTNETAAGEQRIPKIIHQTWRDTNIPAEWRAAQAACKALHPDFEYRLWTDAQSRDFIAAKFPDLLETWDSYPFKIQRADAIR